MTGKHSLKKEVMINSLVEKHIRLKDSMVEMKEKLDELPQTWEELLPLTELSLNELVWKLSSGQLNPSNLLHAFQMKSLKLYTDGNSGICEFIKEANKQAEELTNSGPNDTEDRAPLYGIPFSIKESLQLKTYDTTMGMIKYCGNPSVEDSVIVKAMRSEGAIPFVRTTTSQYFSGSCGKNPVYGDVVNPYSEKHDTGGSSCGEAVLLARRGSPVGIGTDLVGSIRNPASCCGIVGLKPTSNRLSRKGLRTFARKSVFMLQQCAGPMGRSVNDLVMVMKTLLRPSMFSLDPTVPPLPFNQDAYEGTNCRSLLIGYYDVLDDPRIIPTVPAVKNTIANAVEALTRRGHILVCFTPPKPFKAFELCLKALNMDAGKATKTELSEEPLNSRLEPVLKMVESNNRSHKIMDCKTRKKRGLPPALAYTFNKMKHSDELMQLYWDICDYKDEFFQAWDKNGKMDAVLGPTWPFPACPIDCPTDILFPTMAYTSLYNLVDCPAGTFPMGKVTATDVQESKAKERQAQMAGQLYEKQMYEMQSDSEGLPVGVQIIGKPLNEEVVLRVMRELELALE